MTERTRPSNSDCAKVCNLHKCPLPTNHLWEQHSSNAFSIPNNISYQWPQKANSLSHWALRPSKHPTRFFPLSLCLDRVLQSRIILIHHSPLRLFDIAKLENRPLYAAAPMVRYSKVKMTPHFFHCNQITNSFCSWLSDRPLLSMVST